MTGRLVVTGGRVLGPRGWHGRDVVVEGARIVAGDGRDADQRLDAAGLMVVPGLIDMQINGGFGHDFTTDPLSIWSVGARLPRYGVTAFLPTLVSPRPAEVEAALGVLAGGPPPAYRGAVPLGVHCEGPMLSRRRRGVHPASRLRPPSAATIAGWTRARGVRLVTLAPELPGAGAVVRSLVRRGIVVAAGHSDATYEEATRAFSLGVRAGTHLFNAMSGLHHRAPGLAGALLDAAEVRVGLIADGIHVHPAAVALAWRAKAGPEGIVLVSDAATAAGARTARQASAAGGPDATSGGVARDERGVIAGGLIFLDRAVRNVVAFTGCQPAEALRAASASPATLLGDTDRGAIRRGGRADLALLDARLRVAGVIVAGSVVVDRDGRAARRRR